MNIVAIIQSRITSTRFPRKVLSKIENKSILEIIFERLNKSKKINKIVFAIPNNKKNNELKKFLLKLNYNLFCGSENNVLERYYKAAIVNKADIVIRISSDCPLVDYKLVDKYIDLFTKKKVDYLYNGFPHTYPDGMDIEIFNIESLKIANQKAKTKIQKEGVTRYFRDNLKNFKTFHVSLKNDLSRNRWVLDEKNDLIFLKKIFKKFRPKFYFEWEKILKFVNKNKKILLINRNIPLNEGSYMNKNQKLWRRAEEIIPSGNMLLSKNPKLFLPKKWPTYYKKSKGINVWDLEDKKYSDMCLMGVGTNLLGYSNTKIDNAVIRAIKRGISSTLNCAEEVELAEKFLLIHEWAEMVKYARTGGEANLIALRAARAYTNRNKIAFCGYHGWHDWYLSSNIRDKKNLDQHLIAGLKIDGVPNYLKNTSYPFKYGDLNSFKDSIKNGDIAAVIMEVCRSTEPDIKFLKEIRKICKKKNIVLIFDECTSGFRSNYGGIHKTIGINPDIAVFGKAIGNGYAINAIIGKKDIMNSLKNSFVSSTFWTERIGFVASLKTLEIMEYEKSWEQVNRIGNYIRNGWENISKNNNLEINISGLPSLSKFNFNHKDFLKYKTLITQEMLKKKILASNSIYVSTKHNKKIINQYLDILNDLFYKISNCIKGNTDINELLENKGKVESFFSRLN